MALGGTSVRRRRGYMEGRIEKRLAEMRADGRALDTGRASVLRRLSIRIDREEARLADVPEASNGTLSRMLALLGELLDKWDVTVDQVDDDDGMAAVPPPPALDVE